MFEKLIRLYLDPETDPTTGGEGDESTPGISSEAPSEEEQVEARRELESSVKKGLAAVFGGAEADEEDAEEDSPEPEEEAEEEEPEDDTSNAEEAAAEDEDTDPDAPTLPDSYRRSLKAYGWTDDEIAQNLRVLGDKFIDMASKVHLNRNAETAGWAAAGREAREAQSVAPLGEKGSSTPASALSETGLKPVNVKALKEKYGEDDMIDEIVGPVNAVIASINSLLPSLEAGQKAAAEAQASQASQRAEEFFGGEALHPYSKLYGTSAEGLSEEQLAARIRVLETAYDLQSGALALRRQQLPLVDALTLAHDMVSKDFKETAIRSTIKKEAKKRNRGLSLKPSKPGKTLDRKGEPRNRSELESRTRARLKATFGG